MATIFHLIRHGSYPPLGQILAGRTPGLSLNATGRAEAAMLATRLADRKLDAVLASPRERTGETAALIAAPHGLIPEIDDDLDEIDFGAWTGRRFDDLHADPEWRAFNVFRGLAVIPGGETMSAVQARAVAVLLRQRARRPDAEVALVSHGDVIKAMLLHVLGAPLDLMRRIDLAPASRSVVVLDAQDGCVAAINLPPGA